MRIIIPLFWYLLSAFNFWALTQQTDVPEYLFIIGGVLTLLVALIETYRMIYD